MPWSDPVQLTDLEECAWPVWASDGESLNCRTADGGWVRVSRHGEVLSHNDPSPVSVSWYSSPIFSPDGGLYLVGRHEDGSRGIWWLPAEGGEATMVVPFDDPSLVVFPGITIGPENFYLTIAEYESDIWVMDLDW